VDELTALAVLYDSFVFATTDGLESRARRRSRWRRCGGGSAVHSEPVLNVNGQRQPACRLLAWNLSATEGW